ASLEHETQHLLLRVELVVDELNDAVNARQPLQQADLSLVAFDDSLIQTLQGDPLERKQLAVLRGHAVHLTRTAAAEGIYPSVRLAVDAEQELPLLGLSGGGASRAGGRLGDRHLWR